MEEIKADIIIGYINSDNAGKYEDIVRSAFPERYTSACRYLKKSDKLLSLAGSYLMYEFVGVKDERLIGYGQFGKPECDGCHFNISHSGELAVCAKADCDIGVDAEKIAAPKDAVARRVFTDDEYDWYRAAPEERFFTLWTVKESVMKCSGLGFNLSPKDIHTNPSDMSLPIIIRNNEYYVRSFIRDGYSLCVCTTAPVGEITIREYT